jgi:hypothetical protein
VSALATVGTSAVTFASGSGATALFRWWQDRKTAPAKSAHDEVAAAKQVNEMALHTLSKCWEELTAVKLRLDTVEKEQGRITGLLHQAITALRDFLDIALTRDLPTPAMSPELMAEIAGTA